MGRVSLRTTACRGLVAGSFSLFGIRPKVASVRPNLRVSVDHFRRRSRTLAAPAPALVRASGPDGTVLPDITIARFDRQDSKSRRVR